MSQTGGGPILQYYHALNDAIDKKDETRFEAELATLRQYIANKKAEFPGINGANLLLQYIPDEDLQDQGKSREEMKRIYNDVWKFYDGTTQFPNPAVQPQAEPEEDVMDLLRKDTDDLIERNRQAEEANRQCQEELAAALARLEEVLKQKEEDSLLLEEQTAALEELEATVADNESDLYSKELELQTLEKINAALKAEDSEKKAAISKLIQLEHETAQKALDIQKDLKEQLSGEKILSDQSKIMLKSILGELRELKSAFKALNLPDRPSNQALAKFRQENSRLLAKLIAEEGKGPLNEGQLSLKEDLQKLEKLESLDSQLPRTIKEEVEYNEREKERMIVELKTLRTGYLATCVSLAAKVREVQELQAKLGNALADAHVNAQLYKRQLDRNAELKGANVSLSEKVGELEQNTRLLSKSYAEQYDRNQQLKGENEGLTTMLETVQQEQGELEQSKTVIQGKVQQKLADLEGSIAQARLDYSKVKQNPPETNVQISDFLTAGGSLLFCLEIKSALLTGLDQDVTAITQEIANLQTELEDVNTLAKEKLKECDELVKTNSMLLGRIQALQEQLTDSTRFLQGGIQAVMKQNTETQQLITRITAQPPDSAEVQSLRAQLAALTNSSPALQQQLQQVQQQIQALGQGIQAQQQQALAGVGNPRQQQFQQQIQASLQAYTASTQQFQQLQAQAQAASGQATALQASVAQFQRSLEDCERRVGEKEAQRAAATAAATELRRGLERLQAQQAVAEAARVESERQKALLEGQLASSGREVATAQQRAVTAEERERALQQRLERERNPINVQQLQQSLQALAAQRLESQQLQAQVEARQQALEQRVMAAEGANAHFAVQSTQLTGEISRQQEAYNTVNAQAIAAIQVATAAADQRAAAAMAAQAQQAQDFERRLQDAVEAGVAAERALRVATQADRDGQHNEALAALQGQVDDRGHEIRRIGEGAAAAAAAANARLAAAAADAARDLAAAQAAAVAAQAAAVAAANAAAVVAQAAAVAAAVAAETARLTGEIPNVANAVAASELPGGVAVAGANPFEIALIAAIEAAKQRRHVVDQQEIDRIQAILDWHTGVDVVFNPPLPAGVVPFGTVLTFTLANRRDGHAAVFFEYPRGIDYVDVQNDNPKRYVVREGLINYGVFNVF
jgi:chromosome segregation ATPase